MIRRDYPAALMSMLVINLIAVFSYWWRAIAQLAFNRVRDYAINWMA